MNVRFSQLIGWISLVLAFMVAHAADAGALTAAQMVGGSLLGVCGLMASAWPCSAPAGGARRGRRVCRCVPRAVPGGAKEPENEKNHKKPGRNPCLFVEIMV